ncbi:hypothetical protein GCM10012275_63430 [Longimycelium tulufanense]|uniref:Uncharacterized protein n=1 Tax=Longimycelium tulufanense TaxID=907463 RepID=A0A8J3FZU9_9PSEU|nr:hypothetical protein [Longimycelium tulufanense]GGM84116.1 hypothetical protein GCM10012275_63430 [Longimycelium tulufanense]
MTYTRLHPDHDRDRAAQQRLARAQGWVLVCGAAGFAVLIGLLLVSVLVEAMAGVEAGRAVRETGVVVLALLVPAVAALLGGGRR